MKSLPDWAVRNYAEGTGPEATLARMVLEAEEALDQHEQVARKQGDAIRRLREQNGRLRAELLAIAAELRGEARKVKEQRMKDRDNA